MVVGKRCVVVMGGRKPRRRMRVVWDGGLRNTLCRSMRNTPGRSNVAIAVPMVINESAFAKIPDDFGVRLV